MFFVFIPLTGNMKYGSRDIVGIIQRSGSSILGRLRRIYSRTTSTVVEETTPDFMLIMPLITQGSNPD